MKLVITIDLDNPAFEPPDTVREIKRVFKHITLSWNRLMIMANQHPTKLYDINGNIVGTAEVIP